MHILTLHQTCPSIICSQVRWVDRQTGKQTACRARRNKVSTVTFGGHGIPRITEQPWSWVLLHPKVLSSSFQGWKMMLRPQFPHHSSSPTWASYGFLLAMSTPQGYSPDPTLHVPRGQAPCLCFSLFFLAKDLPWTRKSTGLGIIQ